MPRLELPTGRYLTCPIDLSPDAGGQTRALLNRNRLFATEAGISPTILTFNPRTDWAERREVMLDRGLLLEQIGTRNIYDHYREHGWGAEDEQADRSGLHPLPDLPGCTSEHQTAADGTPWRVTHRSADGKVVSHDYLRADGSPFLRIPPFVFGRPSTWPRSLLRVGRDGLVIGEFGRLNQWFRRFVREQTAGERSFVFVDSRYNAPHLIPMRAPHIHLVYVLHNIHVLPPRLWSSPQSTMYRHLMPRVGEVDAFVTLTQRQQDDLAEREGRTSNLFVVPNPVDMPQPPATAAPRRPHQVTLVARLEPQKQLTDAVDAFSKVLAAVPEARLDIFGDGAERGRLEADIAALGIGHAVTLRGHDPHARDSLWTSSAFLLTSGYEGYPLSTLESLSHGCPVVAYDIKYGPREQISDGVDGFLVPPRDTGAVAERVVRLLESPELVAAMSDAAVRKAAQHGPDRFLHDWQRVLEQVVAHKASRTRLEAVELRTTRLSVGGGRSLQTVLRRGPVPAGQLRRGDVLQFAGHLRVRGRSEAADLASASVTLAAVNHETGQAVPLPLAVGRSGDLFSLRSRTPVGSISPDGGPVADVRLRLRLVWQNSSWQTFLSSPGSSPGGADYDAEDVVRVGLG